MDEGAALYVSDWPVGNGCVVYPSRLPDLLLDSVSAGLYQLTDELLVAVCLDCFGSGSGSRPAGGGKRSPKVGIRFLSSVLWMLCIGTILVAVIPFGNAASLSDSSEVVGFRKLVKSCPVRPLPMLPNRVRTLFSEPSKLLLASCSSDSSLLTSFTNLIVSGLRTISLDTSLSSSDLIALARDISACAI